MPTPAEILAAKKIMPTLLKSAELELLAPEITAKALFSAQVSLEPFLEDLHAILQDVLAPAVSANEATARSLLQHKLAELGYEPNPGAGGGLLDLSSDTRLDLIIKTNVEQAQGAAQAIAGNRASSLAAFPALELYRLEAREEERDWPARWRGAGGPRMIDQRMIALKSDPVWARLSRFRQPYPPFDFNSGMWTRRISRRVAIERGLIQPADAIEPMTLPGLSTGGKSSAPLRTKAPLADIRAAIAAARAKANA